MKKSASLFALIAAFALVFTAVGCRRVPGETDVPVTKVEISGESSVNVNGTITLHATVSPEDATDKEVTWKVAEGGSYASVDENGLVTGLSKGTAKITATAGGVTSDAFEVEVTVPVGSIVISGKDTVGVEGTITLTATVSPTNATEQTVTWKVSEGGSYASVDQNGVVTGIAEGKAKITASIGTITSDAFEVNVIVPVTGVVITGSNSVNINDTITLSATVSPTNATEQTVTWKVSEGGSYASIDQNGVVTGLAEGTAKITATAGGFTSDAFEVSVVYVNVDKVVITGSSSVEEEGTITLSASVTPTNATNKTVTWKVSEGSSKASIDANGVVTGLAVGSATIIATADGTNSEAFTVNVVPKGMVLVTGSTITGDTVSDSSYLTGAFPTGRNVTLSSYYMAKYEVTQKEYKEIMDGKTATYNTSDTYTYVAEPSLCIKDSTTYALAVDDDEQENRPVDNVNWFDAVSYCNFRSAAEGLESVYTIEITEVDTSAGHISAATVSCDMSKNGYRLPTEAEWEYATRGGDPEADDWDYAYSGVDTTSEITFGTPTTDSVLDEYAWYIFNNKDGVTSSTASYPGSDGQGTHPVGKLKANRLGIYDMSGNLREWCWDLKADITTGDVTNPTTNTSCSGGSDHHVLRGGCWSYPAYGVSVTYRESAAPGAHSADKGFRVVRNIVE